MVVIDKNGDARPTCINIGCDLLATSSGRRWTGKVRYRPYCGRCHQAAGGRKTYAEGVTPVKKDFCENKDNRLGFKCVTNGKKLDSCMLDLDHIDGNHIHNVPENIQTLCKCCHAKKGLIQGNFLREQQKRYK